MKYLYKAKKILNILAVFFGSMWIGSAIQLYATLIQQYRAQNDIPAIKWYYHILLFPYISLEPEYIGSVTQVLFWISIFFAIAFVSLLCITHVVRIHKERMSAH